METERLRNLSEVTQLGFILKQAGFGVHGPDCLPEPFFLLPGDLGDLGTALVSPNVGND